MKHKIKVKTLISWKLAERKTEASNKYEGPIKEFIIENSLFFSGDYHQHSDAGVPLFNDNTVATYTMRGWGRVMAEAWNEILGKEAYGYMDFYMDCCMDNIPLQAVVLKLKERIDED